MRQRTRTPIANAGRIIVDRPGGRTLTDTPGIYRIIALPYVSFWLAVTAAYEAIYLLTPDVVTGDALRAGLFIMLPAALLGLAVVRIAAKWPLGAVGRLPFLSRHLMFALLFALAWIVAVMLVRNVSSWMSSGQWPGTLPPAYIVRWHVLAGMLIYTAIASAVYGLRVAERSAEERRRAELKALRAQLSPHFLFNTLHTIMALFRTRPTSAEGALETFADLMRYALSHDAAPNARSTIAEEWSFTKSYLELETMRLDDRLRLQSDIARDVLDCVVPPLLIQPLIENAIHHAVSGSASGAQIELSIQTDRERLLVSVRDDGVSAAAPAGRHGIGLDAVRARLQACFGDDWSLTAAPREERGFEVRVSMPRRAKKIEDVGS